MPLSPVTSSPTVEPDAGVLVRPGETYADALTRALTGGGYRLRTGRGGYGIADGFTVFAVAITPSTPTTPPGMTSGTAPDAPWALLKHHDDAEVTWRDPAPAMETQHIQQGRVLTEQVRARFETDTIQQQWREDILRADLAALTTIPTPSSTAVTTPLRELTREAVTGLMRAQQALMLPVWWEDRMSEGHSVEAARMLLALTAHPTLVQRIAFDVATGVPSVRRFL